MKRALIFLIIVFALLFYGRSADYTGRWLDNYGDYTREEGKNDYRVKRAFTVFERVKKSADKETAVLPRLAVIASRKKSCPLVLPDGGIIINPVTLDICYDSEAPEEGDRRLAFIFGHELAHLANKDFIYEEAKEALKRYSRGKIRKELEKDLIPREARTKELFADPRGAIFAAMAGYEIGPLLDKDNNFLRHLAEKTGIKYADDSHGKHPSLLKRYEFIRARLRSVIEQLDLFKAGVLLLQMGKYIDGAAVFRAFSNSYPGREVFNNIGACYLNLALRYLRLKFSDDYFCFRLSTAIDYYTSAEKLYFRGEGDYLKDRDISYCIDKAVFYFREAAYRDRHDRTCRLNLSAALILKKNYAAALAQCDFLLEKNPQDIDAMNNKAIALYYYGKEICNCAPQKAVSLLQEARLLESNNFEVLYNLAALAREMKQPDKATSLWEKYVNFPGIPWDNFYTYIWKELGRKELPPPTRGVGLPGTPEEIKLGEESAPLLEKWKGENVREYKLTSEEEGPDSWSATLQVIIKQNVRVLAWEGFIVLVEQELIRPKKPAELLKQFGPPQKVIHHTAGTFHIYEENGFSLKEINGEICSYIWFKKDF
ncbi:MAG: hypothetical protein GTO45_27780 [Candidatus Aminicenantes bacterium]|nr:hypothetical protein [Candidatus Aminicenantes bacterium]NIM82602.1 hypothetical protein [Candidatus Aminicenantes bacterium]NIN21970.1 hypothetical protein [Candidatus Aminicenantes bacterium]NIN45732.1 hypothetical protein [Candidatus Aminicenantes bacterium]NIN88570.1 hypothetical protein [Candidatus Aminicenantes bacterium]